MLLVYCVVFVLCNSVWCDGDDDDETTQVHGDITGPGPAGNMFEEVFKYAYKNFYKNHPNPPKSSSRERPKVGLLKEQYQYNPPPVPPQPQYIFPQHYYMHQPVPPMPPYHAYYPPYYPHHPPPPPPYGYPYPPVKEKSAEKTTQNLWELYQQLKAKFETTNTDQTTLAENYHRHYNRRVQNMNGYAPRQRYYQQNYQPQQYYQQQQQENEKVSVTEEPFARYTPLQNRQRYERPIIQNTRPSMVETKMTETQATILVTKEVSNPIPERPITSTDAKIVGDEKDNIFEPREKDDEARRKAKVKHWETIINHIKSSLGITEDPFLEMTLPEHILREQAEIASDWFTTPTVDPEAKKYGITLVSNSLQESDDDAEVGFDWEKEEKAAARKKARDMIELYKEHKDKYEFPDYLSEKRRLERAEYKYKKKLLYKSRGMTYDDGQPDDGATFGDDTLLNLGRDPNYYPGNLKSFLEKK